MSDEPFDKLRASDQEDAAALYALDLLDPAERTGFEEALARDPKLRQRVQELREAAAGLAHAAPPADPPPGLRARVLESAGPRTLAFPVFLPWALAACLALALAWTAHRYQSSRSEAALLHAQQTLADLELRSMRNQLEAERIVNQRELTDARQDLAEAGRRLADLHQQIADLARTQSASGSLTEYKVADLTSSAGKASETVAVAVWCPSMQQGILAASKLPRLPSGKDYQLWIIDPNYPAPVSGGVIAVNPISGRTYVTFRTRYPIKSIAKFAVSLEPKGGSVTPQGPIVLLSDSPREPL